MEIKLDASVITILKTLQLRKEVPEKQQQVETGF